MPKMRQRYWIALLLPALLGASVLRAQDADDDFDVFGEEFDRQAVTIADPLEPVNRFMFEVNDRLYFLIIKPVSSGYKAVAPEPLRICVQNFFQNLLAPVRIVNCLLQGKPKSAEIETKRFLVNSTAGILGLTDRARDKHGLQPVDEDLGQTLAVYGVSDGIYLVLPLLGPSTFRDSVGRLGDSFLNPVTYVDDFETYVGINAYRITNDYSLHLGEYETLKAESVGPYIAIRNAYIQYRRSKIKQ